MKLCTKDSNLTKNEKKNLLAKFLKQYVLSFLCALY
jgi:hypothetical protein